MIKLKSLAGPFGSFPFVGTLSVAGGDSISPAFTSLEISSSFDKAPVITLPFLANELIKGHSISALAVVRDVLARSVPRIQLKVKARNSAG